MPNVYFLPTGVAAKADPCMQNDTVLRLFEGFTFHRASLTLTEGQPHRLVIGEPVLPQLSAQAEYVVAADPNGLAVIGRDAASLMHGYLALLMRIEYTTDGRLFVAPTLQEGLFRTPNRMIHFCVFPETSLLFLKKCIRLAGALQFTHVVIEFCGMLKYDCYPSLSFPDAFDKAQIRKVLREVRELGMEPIPMFNHLGHASGCRLLSGKHVVLDQDPSLYALFTPDGWSWNIDNPDALALLRQVRAELYELFGEGSYFHAGLDESYMYANDPALYAKLPKFLGELTREIAAEGRRPMIWMDMFLPPEAYGDQTRHACAKKTPEECLAVLQGLAPETVLIDWQYNMTEAPIPTTLYLKDRGFDIMGAPWLGNANCKAHADTVAENGLFGIMDTTWHTLNREMYGILRLARYLGAAKAPWSDRSGPREETATLLRKLTFEPYGYEESGWMTHQITLGAEKEF